MRSETIAERGEGRKKNMRRAALMTCHTLPQQGTGVATGVGRSSWERAVEWLIGVWKAIAAGERGQAVMVGWKKSPGERI